MTASSARSTLTVIESSLLADRQRGIADYSADVRGLVAGCLHPDSPIRCSLGLVDRDGVPVQISQFWLGLTAAAQVPRS